MVLTGFVCDTPARAFLKRIKGHTGFYGCERCTIKGELINHKLVFLSTNGSERTRESFMNQSNKEHHIGLSPLDKI